MFSAIPYPPFTIHMDGIWMAKVGVARGNDRPREGQGVLEGVSHFSLPPCAAVNGCSATVLHRCCSNTHATLQREKENGVAREEAKEDQVSARIIFQGVGDFLEKARHRGQLGQIENADVPARTECSDRVGSHLISCFMQSCGGILRDVRHHDACRAHATLSGFLAWWRSKLVRLREHCFGVLPPRPKIGLPGLQGSNQSAIAGTPSTSSRSEKILASWSLTSLA